MKKLGAALLVVGAAVAAIQALRPKMLVWGATPEEHATAYPGDDLVEGGPGKSTHAATIDAPPSAVWPWLVQMGTDRAGFYSWDRLDNGGNPSADRIHPEWQDLREGGRINMVPGETWFDVVVLEPERTLALRSSIDLTSGRSFNPEEGLPNAFVDGVWSFNLRPVGENQTRLIVRVTGSGRPRALTEFVSWLFMSQAHWIMQTKQFEELKLLARQTAADRHEHITTDVRA